MSSIDGSQGAVPQPGVGQAGLTGVPGQAGAPSLSQIFQSGIESSEMQEQLEGLAVDAPTLAGAPAPVGNFMKLISLVMSMVRNIEKKILESDKEMEQRARDLELENKGILRLSPEEQRKLDTFKQDNAALWAVASNPWQNDDAPGANAALMAKAKEAGLDPKIYAAGLESDQRYVGLTIILAEMAELSSECGGMGATFFQEEIMALAAMAAALMAVIALEAQETSDGTPQDNKAPAALQGEAANPRRIDKLATHFEETQDLDEDQVKIVKQLLQLLLSLMVTGASIKGLELHMGDDDGPTQGQVKALKEQEQEYKKSFGALLEGGELGSALGGQFEKFLEQYQESPLGQVLFAYVDSLGQALIEQGSQEDEPPQDMQRPIGA